MAMTLGRSSEPVTQRCGLLVALVAALFSVAATAQSLQGRKQVVLSNAQGQSQHIGQVDFEPLANGRSRFRFTLDEAPFDERFLAMRPFKCLTGPAQRLCHFPYVAGDDIGPGDFVALEYRLMFLRTAPNAPHLDPRNGVYYRLQATPNGLAGKVFDVDMDPIITPQGDRHRPLGPTQLEASDPGSHWLPIMRIE